MGSSAHLVLKDNRMPKGYISGHFTMKKPEACQKHIARHTRVFASNGAGVITPSGQVSSPTGNAPVFLHLENDNTAPRAYPDPSGQDMAAIRRRANIPTNTSVEGI